jgi:cyclopropane fatty-acyl-phospholipid synthase-like methyltransferase
MSSAAKAILDHSIELAVDLLEILTADYSRRDFAVRLFFLNHGIAASTVIRRKGPSFIDKYVFPDGGLVSVSTTARIAGACGFEVRDVESLREHYARTLRMWVRRLQSRYEEAKHLSN